MLFNNTISLPNLETHIIKNSLKYRYNKTKMVSGWFLELEYINNNSIQKSTQIANNYFDKNRYHNILAYDDTRVLLSNDNYINANWMLDNKYIATQAPLYNTIEDFWEMIWLYDINNIVMLTNFIENNKEKCYVYFPLEKSLVLSNFKLEFIKQIVIKKNIIQREFILTNLKTMEAKTIQHLQYINWPDFSTPDLNEILDLIHIIQSYSNITCIHCSAGVGRTGVLLTILKLLKEINEGKNEINIIDTILKLRQKRIGMVQTSDQLKFCYQLIFDVYKKKINNLNVSS